MATDGRVALVKDRARLEQGLGGTKQGLDLPELLVLECDVLGAEGGVGTQHLPLPS